MNGSGIFFLLVGLLLIAFALTQRGRDTFAVATGMKRAV